MADQETTKPKIGDKINCGGILFTIKEVRDNILWGFKFVAEAEGYEDIELREQDLTLEK